MPPKKKGAKGGAKGAKNLEAGDKDSLRLAETEIAHLQQHIEIQKHDLLQARAMERLWRQVRCR
jgi:ribosomal protein S15P/S13E